MMNKRNEANLRTGNVIQDDWEQQIVDTFEQGLMYPMKVNYRNEDFLDKIWEMSLSTSCRRCR